MITIIHQGAFTTVQDEGRLGYQAYGLPSAGAMDRYAYKVANILAGNSENAAALEMTDSGAAFQFDEEQLVAVCGADMQGTLNGVPVKNWSSFLVPRGGILKFDSAVSGCRSYVAFAGGVDVPIVLKSRSTYTRAKVGGFEGRVLWQGDVLSIGSEHSFPGVPRQLKDKYIPKYSSQITLRVLLGPQDNLFTQETILSFLQSKYTITERADRTGYYLQGPAVMRLGKADIISDAVCLGAIQVPVSGLPMIMTADHQTTGGFAKLGAVIRSDLSVLAQAKPGDTIHFKCVAEQEAIGALREEHEHYRQIRYFCQYNEQLL